MDRRIFVKNIRSWYKSWDILTYVDFAPLAIKSKSDLDSGIQKYFSGIKPDISADDPVYLITSQAWFYGIADSPLTNFTPLHAGRITKTITLDKSKSIISITPSDSRRKIVDRIKISCEKNLIDKHAEMLEFSILRVKKSIYGVKATHNYKTNGLRTRTLAELTSLGGDPKKLNPRHSGFLNETNDLKTHENPYICIDEEQLVPRGSFFASSEVILDSLDYDLGGDDLILIQKISFDSTITAGAVGVHSNSVNFGIARKEYADYKIEVEYSYGYI